MVSGFRSSGMWLFTVGWMVPGFFQESHCLPSSRIQQSNDVRMHSPIDAISHQSRLEYSATPLWDYRWLGSRLRSSECPPHIPFHVLWNHHCKVSNDAVSYGGLFYEFRSILVPLPSRVKQSKKYCRLHSNWASHYLCPCVADVSLTDEDADQRHPRKCSPRYLIGAVAAVDITRAAVYTDLEFCYFL